MKYRSPKNLLARTFFVSALFAATLSADTVAHWSFGSFEPDTRIAEVSGNGITLTAGAHGMPKASAEAPPTGKVKASATFSPDGGTGSHLVSSGVIPAFNFGLGQKFTIEGWFCLDALDEAKSQTLISNRGQPDGYTVAVTRGKLLFQLQAGGEALVNLEAKTTLQPGTWYFFAVSRGDYGLLSASLYTAAGLVETVDSTRPANGAINSNSKLYVGRRGERQGAGDFLNGKISELRVSNTQLPPHQFLFATKK